MRLFIGGLAVAAVLAGQLAAPVVVRAQDQSISGHDAAGRIAASPGPTAEGLRKPEPLPTLSLQRAPDRRPEPQS